VDGITWGKPVFTNVGNELETKRFYAYNRRMRFRSK